MASIANPIVARQSGKEQQNQLLQQYQLDEYNAQMEKMETEVDLARQEKLLQKELAESMAAQNNMLAASGLNTGSGDAANLLKGTFNTGQKETRSLKDQERYAQNKYITTSAIRRYNYNKNAKSIKKATDLNMVSGFISGLSSDASTAMSLYSGMKKG